MDEPSATEDTIVFGYPSWCKALGAACVLLSLPLVVLSIARDIGWPIVAVFLAGVGLGVYLWLFLQGRVTLDAQCVTLTRLGRTTRVAYADITRLQHLRVRHALVIQAGNRRLRVEKQLQEYPRFYRILCDRLPRYTEGQAATLPLEAHTHLWLFLVFLGFGAAGVFMLRRTLTAPAPGPVDLILGLLFSAGFLGIGVVGLWLVPHKYVFAVDHVEVQSMAGIKVFPRGDLREAYLAETGRGLSKDYAMFLVFKRGRLHLTAVTIDYPPEALYKALEVHWRLVPAHDHEPT